LLHKRTGRSDVEALPGLKLNVQPAIDPMEVGPAAQLAAANPPGRRVIQPRSQK
jgi:hypothetical protein